MSPVCIAPARSFFCHVVAKNMPFAWRRCSPILSSRTRSCAPTSVAASVSSWCMSSVPRCSSSYCGEVSGLASRRQHRSPVDPCKTPPASPRRLHRSTPARHRRPLLKDSTGRPLQDVAGLSKMNGDTDVYVVQICHFGFFF